MGKPLRYIPSHSLPSFVIDLNEMIPFKTSRGREGSSHAKSPAPPIEIFYQILYRASIISSK